VSGVGKVLVDISYGGAFYALVADSTVGLDLKSSPIDKVKDVAGNITG